MINSFKKAIYLYVLSGFFLVHAGSYEDFFQAVKKDDGPAVAALLARGFDPNTLGPDGLTGLFMAARAGAPKVAQVLLAAPETDAEFRNAMDESPLMLAALRGDLPLAQALIARDADVNKPGWTPLHYAASRGQVALISLLLEHHAYIDAESPNGSTPLMMAAGYGSPEATRALLEAGADPTPTNAKGLTALDFAQGFGKTASASALEAALAAAAARK
jgi:ankyrin repeat protein